jgi:hypothetical protein
MGWNLPPKTVLILTLTEVLAARETQARHPLVHLLR